MSELWQRSDRPFTSGEERMWRHLTVAAHQVVPVTEPLLTREEAANDPEVREEAAQTGWVQRRVLQLLLDQLAQDKKQWDESQLFEVTDDE